MLSQGQIDRVAKAILNDYNSRMSAAVRWETATDEARLLARSNARAAIKELQDMGIVVD